MKSQKDWAITANRYVGYIDIMGFKDLVQRSAHEEIYKMMKKINESAQENANILWNGEQSENQVTVTNYSDSIIVYSKNDSFDSCDAFINTMAGLSSDLFLEGIPHRGAFAYGKMTLDVKNSIFFGQPLIDAYLLENELNFYGIVGHSSAEKEISDLKRQGSFAYCVEYPVPFKGTISKHVTIPPIFSGRFVTPSDSTSAEEESMRSKYEAVKNSVLDLRYRTSGLLRKYVDNTVEYHAWLREHW